MLGPPILTALDVSLGQEGGAKPAGVRFARGVGDPRAEVRPVAPRRPPRRGAGSG